MANLQGKAGLVMFVGGGLVIANAWSNGTIQDLANGQIQNSSTPNHKWYQTPWGQIGYEALGVLVGTVIANADDEAGSVVLVFFGVLWLLWLMNGGLSKGNTGQSTIATATQGTTTINQPKPETVGGGGSGQWPGSTGATPNPNASIASRGSWGTGTGQVNIPSQPINNGPGL